MRAIALVLAAIVVSAGWAHGETLEEILKRNHNMPAFTVRPYADFRTLSAPPPPPSPASPPSTSILPAPAPISGTFSITGRATRLFAGPGQFPPANYAAYGIVAFKSMPDASDEKRFSDICRAYVNAIPAAPPDFPTASQMVTVWPVASEGVVGRLSSLDTVEKCKEATANYNLSLSLDYLRRARFQGEDVAGTGPYMLAWAPTTALDQPDAVVLVADLSDVQNYDQAIQIMIAWVEDIEADPEIWKDGFTVEKLRVAVRRIVDKYGLLLEQSLKVKS